MKNKKYILITVLALVVAGLWYFLREDAHTFEAITVPVQRGDFEISVYTSGELEAKNSEDISGPSGLRLVGIWNAQIAS